MNATDPHGDSMLASVTGGAAARRKLAFDLGVDPNTSFPPLADRAQARRHGERSRRDLGQCRHELCGRTSGLCHRCDRHGDSGSRDAARQNAGGPRKGRARRCSLRWAYRRATMDAFYANPNLSPTDKTRHRQGHGESWVASAGRELYHRRRSERRLDRDGLFLPTSGHADPAICQEDLPPCASFVRVGGAPMLQTAQWNRQHSARRLSQLERTSRRDCGRRPRRRRTRGSPETRARPPPLSSAALGWKVVPKAGARLGTYPQLAGWN